MQQSWTEPARRFILTGQEGYLQKAAAFCDDPEITAFLSDTHVKSDEQVPPPLFEGIVDKCLAEGREREGIIVNILGYRFVARGMVELDTYDTQHRAFIERTCMALAKQSAAGGLPECEALFAGFLATGWARLRRQEDSFVEFERAVAIVQGLLTRGDETVLPLLAGLLHNYGNALRIAERFADAQSRMTNAVAILRHLSKQDASRHRRQLASALSDLAAAHFAEGRFSDGAPILEEAVQLHRQAMAVQKTRRARGSYAGSLANLSLLYTEQRRFLAAREVGEESLRIRRELAREEPAAHNADLSASLSNLGMLLDILRDHDGAIALLREAVEIRRSLAVGQPDVFTADLATSLNGLGNGLVVTESVTDHREALQAYEEALDLRQRLAARDRQLYEPAVAQTLGNIAALYQTVGRPDLAVARRQETAAVFRRLCDEGRRDLLPRLAGCLGNLGQAFLKMGEHEASLEALAEAALLWRDLVRSEPEVHTYQLAGILNDLAVVAYRMGVQERAKGYAEEALSLASEAEDHGHLMKGDVSGASWILTMDRADQGQDEEVYQLLLAMRDPPTRGSPQAETSSLAGGRQALNDLSAACGVSVRLVIVEKMFDDTVLYGVMSPSEEAFRYHYSEAFVPKARQLLESLYLPLVDDDAPFPRIEEVVAMGEELWGCLPTFVRDALTPADETEVLLSGDSESLDLPWEAMRFGPEPLDWLGLHRPLTRIPNHGAATLARIRPERFGGGDRTAALVCPWDLPNEEHLDGAKEEVLEIAGILDSRGFALTPGGEPLLGHGATLEAVLRVLVASPAVIHFAGHGVILHNETALALWSDGSISEGNAVSLMNRHRILEARQAASKTPLLHSRPLVVLNACWAGRSRSFGGKGEDLTSTLLEEGATSVIACPTPVHDEIGRLLATLLYAPTMQCGYGIGCTFRDVRSTVQRATEGTNLWWTWMWMRCYGNPFAQFPPATEAPANGSAKGGCRPRALELVRDLT